MPLSKDYKTILVLSYGNKGDDYHKWDLPKIQQIQKIVKYIETYSKEPVEYVDFRNPNDVFVKVKTVNIRLGKLDDTVYKRIERIPSILPQEYDEEGDKKKEKSHKVAEFEGQQSLQKINRKKKKQWVKNENGSSTNTT